jgi:hypothetical protein
MQPLVSALKGHPAIGAWEVMNEPEGSVLPQAHPDQCADTSPLEGQGPNWSGASIPMERFISSSPLINFTIKYFYFRMLRFLNWQLAAIATTDPSALRSVSTWSELSASNTLGKSKIMLSCFLIKIFLFSFFFPRELLHGRMFDKNWRPRWWHCQLLSNPHLFSLRSFQFHLPFQSRFTGHLFCDFTP